MEKSKIARDQMVRHAGSLIEDIDLPIEHVLCLFVRVGWDVTRGTGLDAVEA